MDLKGKVAIVTGGAGGIGRAFCDNLIHAGCKVVICDIDLKAGEELYDILSDKYGIDSAIFCNCDVTDYSQFEETFQRTVKTFGSVDIVINNAGILNDRFWELEVDINLNGVIRGILLGIRFMSLEKGGRGGTIVNIGSNVSFQPYISIPIYTATKHAIVGLTRSFGDTYHEKMSGIRVIGLCPAATESSLVQDIKKQLLTPKLEAAWKTDIANGKSQKADFVAKSLLKILDTAKSGSCWLVENNQIIKEIIFG